MAIWKTRPDVAVAAAMHRGTLVERLGIEVTGVGEDYLRASMPVDERTRQPFGLLHGGASVTLAETLGSYAANCCVDSTMSYCVGLDINANHIRGTRDGVVHAIARPLHLGRRTQVWRVEIRDEQDRLVCDARLTVAVVDKTG